MDSEIKKQNKIPGTCDGFTRPEEISALSKFLRNVKDATEAKTSLISDNLGIRGAEIKDVDELPDSLEVLDKRHVGVSKLVSEKDWLDSGKQINKLEDSRKDLEKQKEQPLNRSRENIKAKDLSNLRESREDIKNIEDPKKLSDDLERIKERETTSLDRTKEKITPREDIKSLEKNKETVYRSERVSASNKDYTAIDKVGGLGNKPETLRVHENNNLESEGIILKGVSKDNILSENVERIKGNEERSGLENKVEKINKGKEIDLGDQVEVIEKNNEVDSLSSDIKKISPKLDQALGTKVEKIEEKSIEHLGEKVERISINEDEKLGTTRENLSNVLDVILGTERENLTKAPDVELSEKLEKIEDTRSGDVLSSQLSRILGVIPPVNLGTDVERIDDVDLERFDTLSKISEMLGGEGVDLKTNIDTLPGNVETLENTGHDDEALGETRINLGEGTDNIKELDPTLERIANNHTVESLGDHRENLEIVNEDTLGTTRINIDNIPADVDLGTTRINIENASDVELGTERVNIENASDVELGDHRENLEDVSDVDLGTERENIKGIEDVDLGTKRENLGNVEDVDLGETRINIENTSDVDLGTTRINIENVEDSELSDHRENLGNVEDVDLGTTRINIEGIEDKELSDHREDLENVGDVDLSDFRDDIVDDGPDSLSDIRIDIEKPDDVDLSDYRDDIEDPGPDSLSDIRIDIEDPEDETLSDFRDDIVDDGPDSLSDIRIDIEKPDDVDLSDFLDDIDDSEDENLSNTLINTPKNDTTKLNYGPNRKKDPRWFIGKDGRVKKGDDYFHKDYDFESYEELKKHSNTAALIDNDETHEDYIDDLDEEGGKELMDVVISRGDDLGETPWDEENLYDGVLATPDNDTTKLNYGPNRKRDSEWFKGRNGKVQGDDYFHENYDFETYNELKEHSNTARLTDNDVEHEDYIDDLDKDGEKELSDNLENVLPNDTSKLNYGLNGKRDTDWGNEEAQGDDHFHKDFEPTKEDLENQKNKYTVKEDTNSENDWLDNLDESDKNALINAMKNRDNTDKYYNYVLQFAQSKKFDSNGWAGKVQSLMSAYLSGDVSPKKMDDFFNALYSTYLDKSMVTKLIEMSNGIKTAEEVYQQSYEDAGLYRTPNSKLPLNPLSTAVANPTTYIRWVAEQAGNLITNDTWHKGPISSLRSGARTLMIDATLWALITARRILEVSTKANRDRLPGADTGLLQKIIQGDNDSLIETGMKTGVDIISGAISGYKKDIDTSKPMNRPERENEWGFGGNMGGVGSGLFNAETKLKDTEGWETVSTRPTQSMFSPTKIVREKGFKAAMKSLGKAALQSLIGKHGEKNYKFKDQYLQGSGIYTTLSELTTVNCVDLTKLGTVEDLFDLFKDSPYISTPNKFSSTKDISNIFTLDSNIYWEIKFSPFVGDINGNISFLPSIHEINVINAYKHGVITGYSRWIPASGFELSKARLNTKNLNLFDGEISYPVSMEYTNEFRLTVIDDQYKSWRQYFEKCIEVSVFNSKPHKPEFYGWNNNMLEWKGYPKDINKDTLTVVDKNYSIAAPYKNITFRCEIFIMTPQFSTINKYDLLLVLKELSEERSGDIEASANDLNLTFSIVGENPRPASGIEKGKWCKKVEGNALDPNDGSNKWSKMSIYAAPIFKKGKNTNVNTKIIS